MAFDITDGLNRYSPCPMCKASAGMGMVSSGGERFVMCTDCQHCGPKVSIGAEDADQLAFDAWNAACALPDYSHAFERMQEFSTEKVNWDGCGGLPASPEATIDVLAFLEVARQALLQVPGLAMGGDGSVAVVWTNGRIYISADFDGTGSHSFFVSEGDEMTCSGVGLPGDMDHELAAHLKKHFGISQPQQ